MRFGVSLPRATAGEGASAGFDRLLRLACRADEIGYAQAEVARSPLSVAAGRGFDPVPLLSAVSALTVGLRIGVAVALDPVYVPEVADRLAVLDNLSHGRLDVSVGHAIEVADACRRWWLGQAGASRPYQSPCPPIFVSAGDASACEAVGRAGHHLRVELATAPPAVRSEAVVAYRTGRGSAGPEPGLVRLDHACHVEESPSRLRARIVDIAETIGGDILVNLDFAAVAGIDAERTLEMFAEQVMPYFPADRADVRPGAGNR
jgi:hypothetical protein